MDYDALKKLGKQIGCSVTDLLALAPCNDPFSAGIAGRAKAAKWFANLWRQHGSRGGHLRRLHYVLISKPAGKPVLLPDGTAYQNLDDDWQVLVKASLAARYLGLIDPDDLEDHRNDEALIFDTTAESHKDRDGFDASVIFYEPSITMPAVPTMPHLPCFHLSGDPPLQNYIIEVWIEKSTQNDWLIPLCRRRGVNLVIGTGEQSEIRSRELIARALCGVPVRVIYLSDCDPGGRSMPQAFARKVEFWIHERDLDVDLAVIPLALTPEQVRDYRLPPIPLKEGERRAGIFEERFGLGGAVELDAMEAIHPGELARLIEAEIDKFLDPDLQRDFWRVEDDLSLQLDAIERDVHARHANEIETLRQQFDDIVSVLEARLGDWEQKAQAVWQSIADELEEQAPDFTEVEVPQSQASGETDSFVLFHTGRSYLEQMQVYLAWRGGS